MIIVNAPDLPASSTKTVRPGLAINGGVDYAASNNLAFSIRGGYQIIAVRSSIYQEKTFQWLQVSGGITFRLNRNQNYLRTDYE
jgi:hypothetical protein